MDEAADCDVLVVGAGVLGAATAFHLKEAHRDRSVLLVDRAGVAQGNTARSVAMVRDTFTSPPSFALARSSIRRYEEMHAELGDAFPLNRMMYLWLFDEEQHRRNAPAVERLEGAGIDVELLDVGRLAGLAPCVAFSPRDEESVAYGLPAIKSGLLCRGCYAVDPIALTNHYVEGLRELGGEVRTKTKVVDFLRRPVEPLVFDGEEVPDQPFPRQAQRVSGVVLADGGRITAGTTVLAVGAWSRELTDRLGTGSLLSPKKRQWFYVESEALAPLFDLPGFGNEDGTLPFTVLPQGIYVKPSREGGMYVALADDIGRPYDLDVRPERDYFVKYIHPFVKGYLPQFEAVTIKAMDAGSYCYDEVHRAPIVDWLHAGVMLVSGASGSGIMKADAMARAAVRRWELGRAGDGSSRKPIDLPGGVTLDIEELSIRGRGRIEPEGLVI
ncbi:MAG: NAD(P)/FAD-dependent oxidoreductase [Planctomycetota bacterium]|jgi:glycine/D-amino acid oxidase-like deaminating enzyme